MRNISSPTAIVIIIGNEILSGRTQDANLSFLGKRFDELGILLKQAIIIPDVEEKIIAAVNESRHEVDYVFTTGGIGPTHDDITTMSVAKAFRVEVERNQEAVDAMNKYYEPGKLNEARLKMADIPKGATLIDNPISGAPGIQIENVFVFPGVPLITQAMFDGITDRLIGGLPVLTENIATNLTEGKLAEGLGMIQDRYDDVSIGSYPYLKKGKLGANLVMRSTDRIRLDSAGIEIGVLIKDLNGKILNK